MGDNQYHHGTSIRSRRRVSHSQADSAAGPSVRSKHENRRHSTKEKTFDRANPPAVDEVSHKHRRSSRRGMDPSVSSTKNGDCMVESMMGCDPTKELRKDNNAVSFKSKARRRSSRDPPDRNRGDDPSECKFVPESGNTAINRVMKREVEIGERPAVASKRTSPSASTTSSTKKKNKKPKSSVKPKKEVKIQGILKKKENAAPPPVAFFGGTVVSSSSNDSSSESNCDGESVRRNNARNNSLDEKSLSSMKSGMRRGKYAAINETALSVTHRSSDDADDSSIESSESERSKFDEIQSDKFDRDHSHFLRTADLGMTQDTIFAQQFLDNSNDSPEPHFHHPTPHPPPGVQFHVDENWICVDDGKGNHSPIAPQAVDGLVVMAYRAANDPMMWTPTNITRKTMTEKRLRFDDIPIPGPLCEGEGNPSDSNCLIWHGKFPHKYWGSDVPAFRSQGIVNMSPEDLVDLIMDSNRVSEYNRSSTGRKDEVVLSNGSDPEGPFSGKRRKKLRGVVTEGTKIIDGTAFIDQENDDNDENSSFELFTIDVSKERKSSFVGVTKIVRSSNKVPLIKRTLQFTTLLHCRELSDEQGGNGYIIVARAITPAEDVNKKEKGVMRSEVLLNVHIIRRLTGKKASSSSSISSGKSVGSSNSGRVASKKDLSNRCLMITVSHVRSPLVPKILQKRVGLSAAANFMSDIRSANH
ncbi:hypothetical protein ACHAXN_000930 [Cyclotella atomus]